MPTTIYYFTGTGNSLQIARELAAKIGDATILPITNTTDIPAPSPEDKFGLVFPVYIWGIPKIIKEFIERIPESQDTYFFAVANCGSSVGKSVIQIRRLLKRGGNRLSAAFKIVMPGNYIPLYGAKKDHTQKKLFARAKQKMDRAAMMILDARKTSLFPHPFTCLLSLLIYGPSMKKIHRLDEEFKLEDNCTGCGVCYRICPVDNICMEDNRPVWQHHCQHCMACLQWCPEEAIQFGKKTKGRTRYHNPSVTAKELMLR